MDSSGHSRNSSSDVGEYETKLRECDNMLARRIGTNIPAPLRKKKEESYKRFLTPTGDPMTYVRQHMRSKSLSDIKIQTAEKDHERDERNLRYEEMQKLKEMLKEEEETWTSNLDSWKQRRKSATIDFRKRKEDREVTEQQTTSSNRKHKTYKEIVEEKKRRESGLKFLADDDDDLFSSLPRSPSMDKTDSKPSYRSAVSSPHQTGSRSDEVDYGHSPPPSTRTKNSSSAKADDTPRYTSRVVTTINVNSQKKDTPAEPDRKSDYHSMAFKSSAPTRKPASVWPPPPSFESKPAAPAHQRPVSASRAFYAAAAPRHSQPPSEKSPPSNSTVQMRHKESGINKQRPKSAYSSYGDTRAHTLPRNYHSYSTPKPVDSNTSDFIRNRKTAFANKRSIFENRGHQKQEATPSAPQHLSALLKNDTDKLQGNERHNPRDLSDSHPDSFNKQLPSTPRSESDSPRQNGLSPELKRSEVASTARRESQTSTVKPWQRLGAQSSRDDLKPYHKRVSAPVSFAKSATLPSRSKISLIEDDSKPQSRVFQSQNKTRENSVLSPRSPSSDVEAQPEEMKICINQRPNCEKGFGFTVKGGEDGKPVVVNSVSPGGAADVCQLCVGDEILAINDVQLSSSLTQEDIVRLIVESVMTGNLSLDIKRYVKSKKPNPLRLSGTKVVMTSGGFVQVRSDKGKPPVVSTKTFNGNSTQSLDRKDTPVTYQQSLPSNDFPPPPPAEDLLPPKRLSAMDRLSPKKPSPTLRRASPLSNLVNAAKSTSYPTQDTNRGRGKENNQETSSSIAVNHRPKSDDDGLESEVLKAQRDLDAEEMYLEHERRQHEENLNLRKQLIEEQRMLEEKEAKREEEKRRRIEEAIAEEQKVVEEIRKIEAAKLEQQKRREEEKRRLIENQVRYTPMLGHGEMDHWVIEEAERSRIAEEEGRTRASVFNHNNGSASPNPDRAMTQLIQGGPTARNAHTPQPHIPGSLSNYWNDPNTRATLL